MTSFSDPANSSASSFGKGAQLIPEPAWGPSIHIGFVWPLLRSAASRSSVEAGLFGAFLSWAATIPSGITSRIASVSLTGLAGSSGHITSGSSGRARATRGPAAEPRRYTC